MNEPVIQATGLRKEYSGLVAVRGIDFQVRRGECFGILGPNGAGKTTTMNMVQGYSPLSGGDLRVFGLAIEKHPRKIKARMGVVPQENNLDPDLTVGENLRVYARYFDIPKKEAALRAARLLEFVALSEKRDEKIPALSGGMKRRLLVARALVNNPELIILDEPTTGLDPQARHLIWQKLRGLKKSGATLALTTHNMEEAAALCDRLVIMDHGRILDEGSPRQLLERHVKGSVFEFEAGGERVGELLGCLDRIAYESETAGDTVFIYTDEAEAVLKQTSCFSEIGFRHRRATLEDVFLKLTGRERRE
jgi:lipooligosaccharide transport system ATP-binding protein